VLVCGLDRECGKSSGSSLGIWVVEQDLGSRIFGGKKKFLDYSWKKKRIRLNGSKRSYFLRAKHFVYLSGEFQDGKRIECFWT